MGITGTDVGADLFRVEAGCFCRHVPSGELCRVMFQLRDGRWNVKWVNNTMGKCFTPTLRVIAAASQLTEEEAAWHMAELKADAESEQG